MSSIGGGPKKPMRSKTSEEASHLAPVSPPRPPRPAAVASPSGEDPELPSDRAFSEAASEPDDDIHSTDASPGPDDAAILLARKDLLLALLSRDERALPARIEHLKTLSGQSLNYREDESKETLLHKCVLQNLPSSLMLTLLENGARVDARDANKASPLHYAAFQGQAGLVRFLLEQRANPMLKDKYNQTALHKAASEGHAPVIEILLDKSVLINHQDTLGLTALHVAARSEQLPAVECLARRGADLLCLTKEGLRPVDCIPTLATHKPRAKPHYSPTGKKVYKFFKRKGGCKKSLVTTSTLVMGDGTRTHCVPSQRARTSITHDLPAPGMRDGPMRACHTQSLTDFTATDQEEVSVESSDSFGELEDLSRETAEGEATPEASVQYDQPRLDKRGFLIKENDPEPSASSPSRKKIKKNAVKEEKRALKWITLFSHWNEHMHKNYDKIVRLCDAGIPDSVRGEAWKHLSGIAVEGRDDSLYHSLLQQDRWEQATKVQIEKDIGRTMPGHILFQEKGQGRAMLTNVLLAYSAYNPEVGYCQGMGFPTAMFLMYMTEEDAFWLLDALCDNYGLGGLYKPGMLRIRQCMRTIGQLMQQYCPKVLHKMEEVGIDYNVFMPQFFLTGFLYCFPFDMVVRIWDSFWLRRFDFLYAVTLGLFKVTQGVIQGFDIDTLMDFLRFREGSRPLDFDIDQLLSASLHVYEKLKPNVLRAWETEAMDELVSRRKVLTDNPADLASTHSHHGTFKRQRSPRSMMRRGLSSFTHHASSQGEARRVDNNASKVVRKTRKTRKKNTQRPPGTSGEELQTE